MTIGLGIVVVIVVVVGGGGGGVVAVSSVPIQLGEFGVYGNPNPRIWEEKCG